MLHSLALVGPVLHRLIARFSNVLSRLGRLTSQLSQVISMQVWRLFKLVITHITLAWRNVVCEVRLVVLPLKVIRVVLLHFLNELKGTLRDVSL